MSFGIEVEDAGKWHCVGELCLDGVCTCEESKRSYIDEFDKDT